jgi:hypothetical protein
VRERVNSSFDNVSSSSSFFKAMFKSGDGYLESGEGVKERGSFHNKEISIIILGKIR